MGLIRLTGPSATTGSETLSFDTASRAAAARARLDPLRENNDRRPFFFSVGRPSLSGVTAEPSGGLSFGVCGPSDDVAEVSACKDKSTLLPDGVLVTDERGGTSGDRLLIDFLLPQNPRKPLRPTVPGFCGVSLVAVVVVLWLDAESNDLLRRRDKDGGVRVSLDTTDCCDNGDVFLSAMALARFCNTDGRPLDLSSCASSA